MKTIAFNRLPGHAFVEPLDIDLIADSALLMPGRPLFIPDFTTDWVARIYVAFRISRLGKSVLAKFAPRYYDSVGLALRLFPAAELVEKIPGCGGFNGLFDNCLTLGGWHQLPQSDSPVELTFSNGAQFALNLRQAAVDEAVACVSAVATIKTGDIIMPCHFPIDIAARPESRITVTAGSDVWLDVRFK